MREVKITPDLDTYYKLIGCDCITIGYTFPNGDTLFVDDVGLLKDPKHFFRVRGIDYEYAGNGVIIGTERELDDEVDVKTDLKDLAIAFLRPVPRPAGVG